MAVLLSTENGTDSVGAAAMVKCDEIAVGATYTYLCICMVQIQSATVLKKLSEVSREHLRCSRGVAHTRRSQCRCAVV